MEENILRKLQIVESEILDEIVRICDKHKITYYLVGGTLLGAIRHKGFIPWDDDLDIAMPRKDYNRFKEICKVELSKKYFLQNLETEPLYFLAHIKMRKNNTIFEEPHMISLNAHKGIFVDIFILDNADKQDSFLQNIQANIFMKINSMIRYKVIINSYEHKTFKQKIILLFLSIFSLKYLSKIQQKLMALNKDDKSEYYVNLGSQYGYKKQTMPKNKYYPPTKVEFEGKRYNVPKDWDYFLTRIYGDYMKIPQKEKRINHNPARIDFGDEITEKE